MTKRTWVLVASVLGGCTFLSALCWLFWKSWSRRISCGPRPAVEDLDERVEALEGLPGEWRKAREDLDDTHEKVAKVLARLRARAKTELEKGDEVNAQNDGTAAAAVPSALNPDGYRRWIRQRAGELG